MADGAGRGRGQVVVVYHVESRLSRIIRYLVGRIPLVENRCAPEATESEEKGFRSPFRVRQAAGVNSYGHRKREVVQKGTGLGAARERGCHPCFLAAGNPSLTVAPAQDYVYPPCLRLTSHSPIGLCALCVIMFSLLLEW